MTDNELASYEKYRRYVKRLLAFSGLWPDHETQTLGMSIFLGIQAVLLSSTTFFGLACSCYFNAKDIVTFSTYVGPLTSYFGAVIKIALLALQRRDLKRLNNGISASFEANLKVLENRQHLLAQLPKFLRISYTCSFATGTSMLLLVCMPLLTIRHGIYVRMLSQSLPFSYKPGGSVYWIIYLYDVLCGWNLWTVSAGTDSLFALYCFHMVGELKLLSSRFRNLKSSENYPDDLKGCIQTHALLMKTFLKLQKVFGFVAFWFAVSSAVCLCTLVFQAVQMDNSSALKKFYLLDYSVLKLSQAYLYSWCGNMIIIESEICLNAAYEAHWTGGDKHFMKDILTVILQRPMVFKANKFMELRMELFLKIANTSVSYFFLLRTLSANSSM